MLNVTGRIHSLESFGAVDGPGVRFVVFFQGCPLRCLFCHNPDTWDVDAGTVTDAAALAQNIISYQNYLSGGVTFSGGEPLLQPEFCEVLMDLLQQSGMHVAIDTSGVVSPDKVKSILTKADLLLLDIKSIDSAMCKTITGADNQNALKTLQYREQIHKPVWIRHVLLPGYTLDVPMLERMADALKDFSCIEKVELLPFHKMGEFKWDALQEPYLLRETQPPTKEELHRAQEIFLKRGFMI